MSADQHLSQCDECREWVPLHELSGVPGDMLCEACAEEQLEEDGGKILVDWRWSYKDARGVGPRLNLMCGDKVAATVFLFCDNGKYNWHVWDRDGVGGENDGEETVMDSMRQAWKASILWGKWGTPSNAGEWQ